MLSPSVTCLVCPERCVHFRHQSCRRVTRRWGHVDKWTETVDNRGGVGKMPRRTGALAGMIRGQGGGATGGVRGLAHPWSNGHRGRWGDVDGLSTPCPSRNRGCHARFRGYPRPPHLYNKDGSLLKKKERNVWKTLAGWRSGGNNLAGACGHTLFPLGMAIPCPCRRAARLRGHGN